MPSRDTGRYPADPLLAIDGGTDGLDLARACLQVIEEHLRPGGSAVLQVGTRDQADCLAARAADVGTVASSEIRERPGRGTLVRFDKAR